MQYGYEHRKDVDMSDINKLFNKLNKYKYISFDLYDTLIFRTVSTPEKVFDLVEKRYNSIHNFKLNNYHKIRHSAEVIARNANPNREIVIDEIFKYINVDDKISKTELINIEISTEIEQCFPNYDMLNLLYSLYNRGKKIIITTDMYLPKKDIELILQKNSIPFDFLFVSSEIGMTKKSGKLFDEILYRMQISPNELAHVGDNEISDIKMARLKGINSYCRIKSPELKKVYYQDNYSDINMDHLSYITKKKYGKYYNRFSEEEYRIGYTVLGPVLAEFCKWVHDKSKNIDKLIFIAREGYLISQIYKTVFPEDEKKIEYIALNKNLLRFPMLYLNCTVEQFIDTIPLKPEYSIEEILEFFFVNNKKDYIVNKLKVKENICFKIHELYNQEFNIIFSKIIDLEFDKIKQQFELFSAYIRQVEVNKGNIALVNNSINGNGQLMLEKIISKLEIKAKFIGLQFVKSHKCEKKLGENCKAWITDSNVSGFYTTNFNRYALMLEHLLFEPTGTSLIFEKKDNCILTLQKKQNKEQLNYEVVNKIQRCALQYAEDEQVNKWFYNNKYIYNILFELGNEPFFKDAELIGKLYDDNERGSENLINKNLKHALWKPGSLIIFGDRVFRKYHLLKMCLFDYIKNFVSNIKYHL